MAANPYELTTREVLSILFKERRKLVGVLLGLSLLVIGYSYTLAPYYEATTRLLVKSGREFQVRSEPGQPVVSVPSATKQEIVNSEIQILTSRDLIEAVVKRIGAARLYPSHSWFGLGGPTTDAAVRRFYSDLTAKPVELSDVIEVSYRNQNRAVAVEALHTVVQLYIQKHAKMFSSPQYKFLRQQTHKYEAELDAASRKVTALKNKKSLFDVDAQRAKLLDDRAALRTIRMHLQSQLVDAHQRIEFLSGRLKTTPQLVTAGSGQADVVEQAKARLLSTEVKAQELRQRYVGDVKPLQDAEAQIASLRRFINESGGMTHKRWAQRNPVYDEMALALSRARAESAPLDKEITLRTEQEASVDRRLRDLETGARALDDAQRERHTLEGLVQTYRARYEEARLNDALDRGKFVSVSVVQQAAAPARPAGPHHTLFALAGILIGLVGAAGVLVYLLVFRETLITVESVERIIGVPVLASVPTSRAAGNDNREAA